MRTTALSMFLIAACALTGTATAEQVYSVDKSHARVGFAVSHMVISKVTGQFKDFDAKLILDEQGQLTSAEATIQVASIDTANEKRDEHLRGADFFDAAQHPTITFVSTGVEQRDGKDVVLGKLAIHGVTREVALPYELKGPIKDPWGNTKLGFEIAMKINRTDYGLTWNKALETGGLVVGEEVDLDINLEFALQ